jgi:hypothetical protein
MIQNFSNFINGESSCLYEFPVRLSALRNPRRPESAEFQAEKSAIAKFAIALLRQR